MKVAFVPTYVSGVMFYRVWQPYQILCKKFKRDKFVVTWYSTDQYTMHPWEWDLYDGRKFPLLYQHISTVCRWADVVVWMGLHTPKALELFSHMRAKYGKHFVSEFDDYIFSIPRYNAAWGPYRPGTGFTKIALDQIRGSDALIVSTPHLAELYKPLNDKVYVVENTVDLTLWKRAKGSSLRPNQGVTIGWMGGGTHTEDHEMVQDAVFEVLEKNENVRFHYVSGGPAPARFLGHSRIKWEHIFFGVDKYPRFVSRQKFHIGIAPLIDNEFNRGKSNLRWLEYSAMGIPTVASPVVHFKKTIRHGKTGLLAGNHAEWVDSLTRLVSEPALRENIGSAARREVERLWTPEIQARKYRAALEDIANAKPNARNTHYASQFIN